MKSNKFFPLRHFFFTSFEFSRKKSKWQEKFYKKEVLSCNPSFDDPVVGACKNQGKWNVKFDIQMDSYSNVVTINTNIDLKFCLMTTKKSYKEVTLQPKYKAISGKKAKQRLFQ